MVFIVQDAKARRACEEKRCCASAHLVPVRRRRVAKDDRFLLNLDRLHLCKQRAPSGVSTASLFQVNVAKGRKRGSRRGQKQNWLKFSTVSSRVAGCQQRNSDWGGVKVIIPSRCPGVSALSLGVGGVPYTSYSQVMENISPSFTRPSCVLTAAATTGKHSLQRSATA